MSQSQHLILNQDKKPPIMGQQQQQNLQSRAFYSSQTSLHMSQSQPGSFQFPNTNIRAGNPMTNQRQNPGTHGAPPQRHMSHQYMNKPPPDYQTTVDPNSCNNALQSSSLCQGNQLQMNMSDSINNNNDQSSRNVDQRHGIPLALSQAYNNMIASSDASRPYPGMIPLSQLLYSEIFPSNNSHVPTSRPCPGQPSSSSVNTNARRPYSGLPVPDLLNRPCSGESPSSDSSSNVDRPFPGIIPINDVIPRSCANESPSNTNSNTRKQFSSMPPMNDMIPRPCSGEAPPTANSNAERPYQGMVPMNDLMQRNNSDLLGSNKQASDSNDRPYPDVVPIQEIPHVARSYAGMIPMEGALSMNRGCSNSGPTTNTNLSTASKPYSSVAFSHSTSVSGPYSNMSSIYAMSGNAYSQASHSGLTSSTITPSTATSKGRSKQLNSRANSKQCTTLQRQQKAPNVNVGPDGLNISQRPPTMTGDWRQAYGHHNQHPVSSNMNDEVIVTYSRDGNQEYGPVSNPNVNFQSGPLNTNSPVNDSSSILSIASNTNQTQLQSSGLSDIDPPAGNQLLMQQSQTINGNNTFQNSSQLQMPGVSATDMNQSNLFSTSSSPNNSLQNIVPDGSQFNLDFLDNMDCSTSDLLNFDVIPGESSSFPILDDITMLDK